MARPSCLSWLRRRGDTPLTGGEGSHRQGSDSDDKGKIRCSSAPRPSPRTPAWRLHSIVRSRRRTCCVHGSALRADQQPDSGSHPSGYLYDAGGHSCGIYNNPSRLWGSGDARDHQEAVPTPTAILWWTRKASTARDWSSWCRCRAVPGQGKNHVLRFPKYSISPTLAVGGTSQYRREISPRRRLCTHVPGRMKIIEEANYMRLFQVVPAVTGPVHLLKPRDDQGGSERFRSAGRTFEKPYQDFGGQKLADLEKLHGRDGRDRQIRREVIRIGGRRSFLGGKVNCNRRYGGWSDAASRQSA